MEMMKQETGLDIVCNSSNKVGIYVFERGKKEKFKTTRAKKKHTKKTNADIEETLSIGMVWKYNETDIPTRTIKK